MKELKISTKLASAVLGKEVTKCSLINKERNSINITYFEDKEDFNTICRGWNIYEFAYENLKQWALQKGFNIFSSCKSFRIFENGNWIISSRGEDNEIEAIINACNWILEKSNEKT